MNYLIIPFFTILIVLFQKYIQRITNHKRIRENSLVMWCVTLLFSLLGAISSYHMYQYDFTDSFSTGFLTILALYLILTFLFIAVSPSRYRRLLGKWNASEEEILYAEYRFNHSLEMLRSFFLGLLLIVPLLYSGYRCLQCKLPISILLEEAYLIGGLYFVAFCILFPLSMRQSIFWLRQLQRFPKSYEHQLLQEENTRLQYYRKNRKI